MPGHKVVYLVAKGSGCPFAHLQIVDDSLPLNQQIPGDTDLAHFHFLPNLEAEIPFLVTVHGNWPADTKFFNQSCFLSENHARRYQADC